MSERTRPTRERPVRSASSSAAAATPASAGAAPSERSARRPVRGGTPAAAAPAAAGASARGAARASGGAVVPVTATAPAASADPANKPRDFMVTVHELTSLLLGENEALNQHNLDAVRDNIPKKQQLTRAYMEQMIAFHKNPAILQQLPSERRDDMKEAMKVLEPLIAQNGQMLRAKIDTINRFMGVVVEAVKEQTVKDSVVYGGQGAMDSSLADHKKMAVAINREL